MKSSSLPTKKYGEALAEEDIAVIYWPEQFLPEAIFRDKAVLFPENADGPRYIMRSTEAFERSWPAA